MKRVSREGFAGRNLVWLGGARAAACADSSLERSESLLSVMLGRQALAAIGEDLRNRDVSEIWVPAWICDVVPEAFAHAKLSVHYYPVQMDGLPEWNTLETLPVKGALLYVSYFGRLSITPDIEIWAKKKGLLTIADHAHSLLGMLSQDWRTADYTISSIGKAIGLRFGSWVQAPQESLQRFQKSLRTSYIREVSNFLSSLPPKIEGIARGKLMRTKRVGDSSSSNTIHPISKPTWELCRSAPYFWHRTNHKKVAAERRKSYRYWQTQYPSPMAPDLFENEVPWIYPLHVKSKEIKATISDFEQQGIEAFIWPNLPKDLSEDDPSFRSFYRECVALPVWKDLTQT